MPADASSRGWPLDGWRSGAKFHEVGIAHFFDADGNSLCGAWRTTAFDRPAVDEDRRCDECLRRVTRTEEAGDAHE